MHFQFSDFKIKIVVIQEILKGFQKITDLKTI